MRRYGTLLMLIAVLSFSAPVHAQLRDGRVAAQSESLMQAPEGVGLLMKTLFNPEHFAMSHAFEMSVGGSSYGSSSLAMYTNSLQWRFGNKLAARADVSVAYSPFGNNASGFSTNPGSVSGRSADVFLRNASVRYQPSENVTFNLSYHRSPYGNYLGPYGRYRPVY